MNIIRQLRSSKLSSIQKVRNHQKSSRGEISFDLFILFTIFVGVYVQAIINDPEPDIMGGVLTPKERSQKAHEDRRGPLSKSGE